MLPAPPPAMAPAAIGKADGWGMDDTTVVIVAIVALLLTVALVGSLVPQHGGRVSRWKIAGRPPKWVALCMAGLNAGMAVFLIQGVTAGTLLQGPAGIAIGLASFTSSALMVIGWWVHRLHHWLHSGMLVSACVWAGIAAANLTAGITVSGWVALWITATAAVTWLTEVTDDGGRATGGR